MRFFTSLAKFAFAITFKKAYGYRVEVYRRRFLGFYSFLHVEIYSAEDLQYGIMRWKNHGDSFRTAMIKAVCDRAGYLYHEVTAFIQITDAYAHPS